MTLPEPTPVLLAGNLQHGVLAAVRALRVAGYAPWLAVDRLGTYAGRSRATAGTVLVPKPTLLDSEGFVQELATAAQRLSAAAVLPSTEVHLCALAGRESDFPRSALGVPARECVVQATNKDLLPELVAAAGLRTPPTKKVVQGDDETVSVFGFPAIVKPLRSWLQNPDGTVSSYKPRYVSNEQEAREALEAFPGEEGLVQPYISGPNISISGVSWGGKLVCALHHLSSRIWPLTVGITAYAKTIPPDVKLEQGISRLLQVIGWSGIFEVEFKRSLGGEHYLIDLNPRIYGSLALAVAAGLNLPEIWVDLLLGRQPNVDGYRVGVGFRQEERDARALAVMLAVGSERRHAFRGLMPRRGTTHAIFALRDPLPLLTSAANLAKWCRQLYRAS